MNLLDFTLLISGVVILILTIDISRRKKMNGLHILLFLSVGIGLLVFTIFPSVLGAIGKIFGIQRGADALVYTSILFLFYFMIQMFNRIESQKDEMTKLVREIAIQYGPKEKIHGEVVFLMRAYNEASVIGETITAIIKAGFDKILVVDDGSMDLTQQVLEGFKEVSVIRHLKNRGGGAALETGLEYLRRYAQTKYVCTFDADGQHQIQDYKKFANYFEKHPETEIIFGSRFIEKTNTNVHLIRKLILKGGVIFTYIMSGVHFTDSHNGYRVMRTSVLPKIRLSIDGMGYASELVDLIAQKKIIFAEVPVDILYTDYSRGKGQSSLNAINIAVRMIWNKFFR